MNQHTTMQRRWRFTRPSAPRRFARQVARSLGAAVTLFHFLRDEDARLRSSFPYLR